MSPGLWPFRLMFCFFFSSRRRHTRFDCDWSSDVCSSDLLAGETIDGGAHPESTDGRSARWAMQRCPGHEQADPVKALVFLLVLANLLFYAFGAGYFGRPDNPDAGRVEQQILPERMRIAARGDAPALPAKAPEPVVTEVPKPEIAGLAAA